MTQSNPIHLASLLSFDPAKGEIRLEEYRMVMLSAAALGCLRKELIETVGRDEARALMKRFGHAAGLADALDSDHARDRASDGYFSGSFLPLVTGCERYERCEGQVLESLHVT